MSNEYQLRKDIDRFKTFLDNLEYTLKTKYNVGSEDISVLFNQFYDASDVDMIKARLKDNLNYLQDSLVKFNGALIDFDEDNTNLDTDLEKMKENLIIFRDAVETLQTDLENLDVDLSHLKRDLNILSDYLVAFEGSLAEFEEELREAGIDVSSLNEDVIKLFHAIGNVKSDINVAQTDITNVQTDIGDTTALTGTIVDNIESTQTDISNVQSDIGDVTQLSDDIVTTIGSVQSDIGDAQTDITDLETSVGTVDVASDGDLQTQIFQQYEYSVSVWLRYNTSTESEVHKAKEGDTVYFVVEVYDSKGDRVANSSLSFWASLNGSSLGVSTYYSGRQTYVFTHTLSSNGLYVFQIGNCTLPIQISRDVGHEWVNFYDDANYTVYYNDYFVTLEWHILNTSATTSWQDFGASVLTWADLRPQYSVVGFDYVGNVLIRANFDRAEISRKTLSGTASGADLYGTMTWKRKNVSV